MKWKPILNELSSYKPGKREEAVMEELGLEQMTKLSSNENPLGASPFVYKQKEKLMEEPEIYPDGHATELRETVSNFYNLHEDELIFTAGVDELIAILARALLTPATNTVMAQKTFVQYRQNALIEGAEVREVPLLDDGSHDLANMLSAIDTNTSIVWLCNPNNPTGNYLELDAICEFLQKVPEDVLVVLDEAYIEYVTPVPESHEQLIHTYKNLIITRTFSKIYGLASARVGYGMANKEIIQKLNIIRPPFNTASMSQNLAKYALLDQSFVAKCRKQNRAGITLYEDFAADHPEIKLYPAAGNFVLIDLKCPAEEASTYLEKNGYIVRPGTGLGFKTAIRITVGTEEANKAVIRLLEMFLQEQGV